MCVCVYVCKVVFGMNSDLTEALFSHDSTRAARNRAIPQECRHDKGIKFVCIKRTYDS